ncbi:gas vesicle protein [Anaerosolibacter carboniphilus]|uniref:Gas vesicle protein n=1 Tax=Anaerosolibacter carboniphilus TaxID=1417629 RepID=A0A841KNF0_9FIRM|nr:YtxH domain-containing protein [Anaerosolibacter carboniphilus]MBB6214801.1 gas vesicle protein [Anaerosolibacter carboniphilus]
MRDKFMTGIIAGGIIGATAGLYAFNKMSPRQRRKLMKRGSRVIKNASNMIGMTSPMNMF